MKIKKAVRHAEEPQDINHLYVKKKRAFYLRKQEAHIYSKYLLRIHSFLKKSDTQAKKKGLNRLPGNRDISEFL